MPEHTNRKNRRQRFRRNLINMEYTQRADGNWVKPFTTAAPTYTPL